MKFNIKDLFKKEEEIIDQVVYDAYYSGECPLCKTARSCSNHKVEEKPNKPVFLDSSFLVECFECHCAFYVIRTRIEKTLKKYRRVSGEYCDLKLISSELVNVNSI